MGLSARITALFVLVGVVGADDFVGVVGAEEVAFLTPGGRPRGRPAPRPPRGCARHLGRPRPRLTLAGCTRLSFLVCCILISFLTLSGSENTPLI